MAATPTFEAPGPGFWVLDTGHLTTSCSGYTQALFRDWFLDAFNRNLRAYGSLLESLDWEWVNGFPYFRLSPVGVPPGATALPSRAEWDEIARTHPDVRERLATAERTMIERRWRTDLTRWDEIDRPRAVSNHRKLLAVDPEALDDGRLLAYLARCTRNVEEGVFLHHSYNMAAWIAVGDFVAHAVDWTGRPETEIFGLLGGASPDALGGERALGRLVEAARASAGARKLLTGSEAGAVLAALRAAPGDVGEAARDYVDLVAYRPVNGEDVGDTCAFELPDLLVNGIRAAVEAGVRPSVEQGTVERVAAVRADVPAERRAAFDELLDEARLVYRLREERAVFGDQWAYGVARRALLGAGERLVERGQLEQAAHLVEATWPEAQAVLRGDDGAPTAAELAARAHYRATARFEDVPQTLGPPPGPPLPLEWLPPLAARLERALGTVVGALFGGPAPESSAAVVRGLGVSPGVVEGPARILGSSSEFGRIRQGDILFTRGTTAAFNIVLPLIAGIVTDRGGLLCHAAIVSREYGIPAVVGCGDATSRVRDGTRVRVDGAAGEVTILG